MMKVLSLFAGIGGFDLGLERTGGFKTVAFCEIDPFCRRVLAKHWPGVPCYDDVRLLTAKQLSADGIAVDVICDGFPCQDISGAGKRAGIEGDRSGLWSEYARLIGEIRPRLVLVENVAALLGRGMGRVLGDLAALGYDAEWHCIPAAYVGAPHIRDRVWIVAYPGCEHGEWRADVCAGHRVSDRQGLANGAQALGSAERGSCDVADAAGARPSHGRSQKAVPAGAPRILEPERLRGCPVGYGAWFVESGVGRVANGTPSRVDRLTALGNAVVPQIPALIGRAILAAEGR